MNLQAIYKRHAISPDFQPEFDKLVHDGRIDNSQFRLRLQTCNNYRACLDEIVADLLQMEVTNHAVL